jgi:hypothetical protein
MEFGRFAVSNRKKRGEGKPETFTSGFTHHLVSSLPVEAGFAQTTSKYDLMDKETNTSR